MKKIKKILLLIFTFLIIFSIADVILSTKCLTTSYYELNASTYDNSIRIIQLTDLHNSKFGDNNKRLVKKVQDQSADVILVTGDLINNKTGAETDNAVQLIEELCKVAPVYVSYGNQEYLTEKKTDLDVSFAEIYEAAGAIVLEKEWVDVEIKGQPIRIGGIYGYCLPDKFSQENNRQEESEFLKEFQNTDRYTILMSHLPYSWINGRAKYDWDIDLVFTGHLHGGQIRIPFIGGLYAPEIGWLPGQLSGVYVSEEDKWQENFDYMKHYAENTLDNSYYSDDRSYHETTVILSRGLGNTEWVPRFNNIPEIVVADITSKIVSNEL